MAKVNVENAIMEMENAEAKDIAEVTDLAELVVSEGDIKGTSIFDAVGFDLAASMTQPKNAMSTMVVEDEETKIDFFNAISNPTKKLQECIGETIAVKDVYIEIIELESEQTKKLVKCPRIILIDLDGNSFQCVSMGIYNSLATLFKIYGMPTWKNGLKLRTKSVPVGKNNSTMVLVAVK